MQTVSESSRTRIDSLLDMHLQMRVALETRGWCFGERGDWKKAAEIIEEVHRLSGHPLKGVTPLGCGYANLGENEKAMECIRKIEQPQAEEPEVVLDIDLAIIRWFLGIKTRLFIIYLYLLKKNESCCYSC